MSDSSDSGPELSDWDHSELIWDRKAFYVYKIPIFNTIFSGKAQKKLEQEIEKIFDVVCGKGYQIPSNPMVLIKKGLLFTKILLEIHGIVTPGNNIKVYNDVPVYTSITTITIKNLNKSTREFSRKLQEQGKKYSEIYFCNPDYTKTSLKTVLLALEG
ncbi:MAG: hypothetical protein KAX49_10840 [Halanaerobiales bacterium]|nr:hypothetical protein [Halanaerobiales bacterium]